MSEASAARGAPSAVSATTSSIASPSGSAVISEPSERSTGRPSSASRSAQKSSDAGEGTRHTTRWIIPGPGRPRGTPRISKNVRMLPGDPDSSPRYRWYMSGASKLTVFFTSRSPMRRT